jgi:hypothetical protein
VDKDLTVMLVNFRIARHPATIANHTSQ